MTCVGRGEVMILTPNLVYMNTLTVMMQWLHEQQRTRKKLRTVVAPQWPAYEVEEY